MCVKQAGKFPMLWFLGTGRLMGCGYVESLGD